MRGQLEYMVTAGPNLGVSVRVLPTSVGPHQASRSGAFVLLSFPEQQSTTEPPTVYIEGLTGALYLDKPAEVVVYEEVWDSLWEKALSPTETGSSSTMIQEL